MSIKGQDKLYYYMFDRQISTLAPSEHRAHISKCQCATARLQVFFIPLSAFEKDVLDENTTVQ